MTNQFYDSGKPTDVQALNQVEQQLGVKLPLDYRRFLLNHNGGRPERTLFTIQWANQSWAVGWEEDDVGDFYAVDETDSLNLLSEADTYAGRIPANTIPIGNDPFNNQILLGVGDANFGNVYFWMFSYEKDKAEEGPADYRNVGFVASSFDAFVNSLRASE